MSKRTARVTSSYSRSDPGSIYRWFIPTSAAPSSRSKRVRQANAHSTRRSRTGASRREDRRRNSRGKWHETLRDFCGGGAIARWILVAADQDHHVGILEPPACRGGGEAFQNLRHDAAIQLSVRSLAIAHDRRG